MTEKPVSVDRKRLIIRLAQSPIFYLESNKSKGCVEAIRFLWQLRDEIKNGESDAIEDIYPDLKIFVVKGNGSEAHTTALCRMLKDAGYDKNSVLSAGMDLLPDRSVDVTESRSTVVKSYLDLLNKCVTVVYGKN